MKNDPHGWRGGTLRQAIALLLVAVIPAVATGFLHPKRPSWNAEVLAKNEITIASAFALKDVLWVDARSGGAFDKDHIPGALPLNEDAWSNLVPAVLEAWNVRRPIVIYCDSRECESSQEVAKRLGAMGVSPIYVLKGGWAAWQESNP